MTQTASELRADENRLFLLLHSLFVEIEVVGFENVIAAVVN